MNYVITNPEMERKMERALHDFGDVYTLDDIMHNIQVGKMQSFSVGETWIVTQVNEYPQKKVLEIALVVGHLEEAKKALPEIYKFARSIGAHRISAIGREGWWEFAEPGWFRVGTIFAKELKNGR